jgi:hypothetical protein
VNGRNVGLVLGNQKIYTNLKEIIDLAHGNKISLVVFRPAEVLGFVAEAAEPEWPHEKITGILNSMKQGYLFEDQSLEDFRIMPKLPYKFSYRFKDDAGVQSKLMIEGWEIGQLYWNCEKRYGKDQAKGTPEIYGRLCQNQRSVPVPGHDLRMART